MVVVYYRSILEYTKERSRNYWRFLAVYDLFYLFVILPPCTFKNNNISVQLQVKETFSWKCWSCLEHSFVFLFFFSRVNITCHSNKADERGSLSNASHLLP